MHKDRKFCHFKDNNYTGVKIKHCTISHMKEVASGHSIPGKDYFVSAWHDHHYNVYTRIESLVVHLLEMQIKSCGDEIRHCD